MTEAILVAIITSGTAIICQILINRNNRQKMKEDAIKKEKERAVAEAQKEARQEARLNAIEKNLEENNRKLDIHNGYAEKIGQMQQDISYIRGKMDS